MFLCLLLVCSLILPSQSLPSLSSKTHWKPDLQQNCEDKKNEKASKENNAGCTLEHPAMRPQPRQPDEGLSALGLLIRACQSTGVQKF